MSRRSKPPRGVFVVVEGVDGAGTTTQATRVADALRAQGKTVLVTREPSDGPIGVIIRQALSHRLSFSDGEGASAARTLGLLFAADRLDHLATQVSPALARGEVVISDRYLLSSLAYQGPQTSMKWVEEINQAARIPDLTLFLNVGARAASRRRHARGGEAELFEREDFQRRLQEAYRKAIRLRQKKERIVVLDGESRPETVTALVLATLEPYLQ